MSTWDSQSKKIAAVTLFVEDLVAAKDFYREIFNIPLYYEDANSAVFRFGESQINLLMVAQAQSLIDPATVAGLDSGSRIQFTMSVDDVDAVCEELRLRGVGLLNGPMDRPWGVRTASFMAPGGHIWEIAHDVD